MDVSSYHSASVTIHRAPAELFAIVSDLGRMGDLSPVCHSCTWDDVAEAGDEGAWFTGHNAIGDVHWDTRCRVVVSDPGREFAFVNFGPDGDHELVRWGFTFEQESDGTKVTESWQVLPAYPAFVSGGDGSVDVKGRIDGMATLAREGIGTTLDRLKRVAES